MTDPAAQARDLALQAERVAVDLQHAGFTAGRTAARPADRAPGRAEGNPAVIGPLQLAADCLWSATRALGMSPSRNGRPETWAVVTTALTAALLTAALLLTPHPTRPWVLALLVSASTYAAHLLWRAGRTLYHRRVPPPPPRPLADQLTELRTGLVALTAALEPAERPGDLEAGRRIELALVWLEEAELEAHLIV
jgi:hypothetical protein